MQTPSFGEKASKKCDPCLHIFFLSLIVYIFKNFSQIFADMSACLSDNKVIFTRETVLKFILRGLDVCFFFVVRSYNSMTICLTSPISKLPTYLLDKPRYFIKFKICLISKTLFCQMAMNGSISIPLFL